MFKFVVLSFFVASSYGSFIPNRGLAPLPDGRIVGGHDAEIEDFPWQISMRYYGSHRCGASILTTKTIISAGHCVAGVEAKNLQIVAGSTLLSTGGISKKVKSATPHPKYNPSIINYDLSILILETPLEFGLGISPIAIPAKSATVATGELAVVSGWGTTKEGGAALPTKLQAVEVPIVDQLKCSQAYAMYGGVTDYMICAGHTQGGKDSCQGDSGGPMVVNATLVGVVSWGYGCARPRYPGVYARVVSMRDWLDTQIVE